MSKKGKEIAQEPSTKNSYMSSLFSDTTCNKGCGSSSWEAMYKLFEDEKPRVITKVATTSASATRPKIIPYTDMVKWVSDHLNIEDRTFKYSKGKNIGSFKVEYLQAMYHLPSL